MRKPTDTDALKLTRRWFLTGLTALVFTRAAPDPWPPAEGRSHAPALLGHFFRRDLPAAVHLGRRYLEIAPAERSEERLGEMLLGSSWGDGRTDIREIATRVRARRDADFRAGDLVAIEGWFLARTEARLCALAALAAST